MLALGVEQWGVYRPFSRWGARLSTDQLSSTGV